jgi:hypothetical protein
LSGGGSSGECKNSCFFCIWASSEMGVLERTWSYELRMMAWKKERTRKKAAM